MTRKILGKEIDAVKIQGVAVDPTAPEDTQVLAYDLTEDKYIPAHIRNLPVNAYGVKWDYENDVMTAGIPLMGGGWLESDYTSFPVQEQMRRCVLETDGSGVAYYLHDDDSRRRATPATTGTADGTTASHLIDSGVNFDTGGLARVGDYIYNSTDDTYAQITAVADGDLTLDADIFVSGESYEIGANLEGTDGQVMVEIPAFYMMVITIGMHHYFLVSEEYFSFGANEAWIPEGFNGHDKLYVGAFQGLAMTDAVAAVVGSVIKDTSGYTTNPTPNPFTDRTRPQFRTQCASAGTGFAQMSHAAHEIIQILFLTEYKTWNSQTALPGYTGGGTWDYAKASPAGVSVALGNVSGSVGDGTAKGDGNSYRGIENVFGNVWVFNDGINVSFASGSHTVYVSADPDDFADDTATGYSNAGNISIGAGASHDYIKNVYANLSRLMPFWPTVIGGGADSGSYITDYLYVSTSTGWRVVRVGGDLSNDDVAGVGCRHATNASSSSAATVGARLLAYVNVV